MQCKNCHNELTGEQKFCSNCGQKNIAKLNLKYITNEFFDALFNWDSKFFKSLKYLAFKPGKLSLEFVQGKRVSYVAPIRMYIIISVLFFFTVSVLSELKTDDSGGQIQGVSMSVGDIKLRLAPEVLKQMQCDGSLETYVDSLITATPNTNAATEYFARKMIYSQVNNESFGSVFSNQLSLFLLVFVPFLALLYGACFSGNKLGFISHLIFNFHVNSFFILLLFIPRLLVPFINNDLVLIGIIAITFIVSQVYLLKAIKVFYQRKWYVNVYKYLFLLFGYVVLVCAFIIVVFLSSLIAT